MTTITIPKNLMSEKDLMLVSRLEYERLLKHSEMMGGYEHLWKSAAKNKFFQSYSKSDAIYDRI